MENNEQNIWDDNYVAPTPPAAEQPAAVIPEINTAAIDPPAAAVPVDGAIPPAEVITPVINEITPVEKVTERIVEKYPEFADDHSKALFEAFQKGDEDSIYNYLAEKKRDYNSMSDYDVVKAGLKRDNPDWTDKRLDLEFKTKYDIQAKKDLTEIDETLNPEAYDKAVAFNDAIVQREALLEMQAEDYRIKLNNSKKDIQLPKIQEPAAQVNEPTAEEIAQQTKAWTELVSAEMPTVSDLKLTINGEEVVYKVTDEDRTSLAATMNDFNAMDFLTKERKWINEDGSPNIKNMAEDVYKFRNMDKMFSSVATRAKNEATKNVVAEIKNIDLTRNAVNVDPQKKDAGEAVWNY